MNSSTNQSNKSLKKVSDYFRNLGFFLPFILGGPSQWVLIIISYLSFGIGVFAKQILQNPINTTLSRENINMLSFVGSLIIGLALYPFALRLIIKQEGRLLDAINPNYTSKKYFNILHFMTSFSIGYFYSYIIVIIPKLFQSLGI